MGEFIVEKIIKMAEDDDSEDESSDGDSDREELDESDEEEGEKKKPGCLDKIMPGAGGGAHYGKDRKVEKMIEKVELPGISDREDLLPLLRQSTTKSSSRLCTTNMTKTRITSSTWKSSARCSKRPRATNSRTTSLAGSCSRSMPMGRATSASTSSRTSL